MKKKRPKRVVSAKKEAKSVFEIPELPKIEPGSEIKEEEYNKISSEYNLFISKLGDIFKEKEKSISDLEKENRLTEQLVDEKNLIIKKLEEELNSLKRDSRVIFGENISLGKEQVELKEHLRKIKDYLVRKESEVDHIKTDDLELIRRNEKLLDELEKVKDEFGKNKIINSERVNQAVSKIEKLNMLIKEKEVEIKKLGDKLKTKDVDQLQLSREFAALHNELMKTQELLAQKEDDFQKKISKKDDLITKLQKETREKDAYYPMFMEVQRQDYEDEINRLKSGVAKQPQIIKKFEKIKVKPELKPILEPEREISFKISKPTVQTARIIPKTVELPKKLPVLKAEEEQEEENAQEAGEARPLFETMRVKYAEPTKGEEQNSLVKMLPIIDIAIQNGSKISEIRDSLVNSGYNERDVEKALDYYQAP